MWNKIKNPFGFKPDALAVAYIDAIRKDYNRLGRGKWYDMRADVYNACDRHSRMWIDAELSKIQKEKVMVELCALQLESSADEPIKSIKSGQSPFAAAHQNLLKPYDNAAAFNHSIISSGGYHASRI